MPTIVQGATNWNNIVVTKTRDYQYPFNLDLKPSSKLHQDILSKLKIMVDESYKVMSQRHKTWNEIDKTLKVYIPLDDYEKNLKLKDKRRPVSVVVPYSYATLETILSYMTKVFLTDTIFQYEGNGPEDTIPAKLLEIIVNQQVNRFKSMLEMHTTLRDGFAYGLGASTLAWAQRWGKKPVIEEMQRWSMLGRQLPAQRVKNTIDAMLFEGNEVIAIDPYRFLPDPNISIHNVQAGEYCGWIEFKSLQKLLSEEASGEKFNIGYLRDNPFRQFSSMYSMDASERIVKKDPTNNLSSSTHYVTEINMYADIIPQEWGIKSIFEENPRGEYPEKWLFTIENECLISRAIPLQLNHGLFPIATLAPDYDGYSVTPLARMELIGGLQTVLDWLFNSHITNVRKAINDMFVVDPSLVNMNDLENPEPGKLIRLRRSAWGRGVDQAVKQLSVVDITKSNMQDAMTVMEFIQKASGANDSTMGVMRQGNERITAAEYSGTMQMAISRLDRLARIISKQYFTDMAYFHASHTQQFMTQATYAKAVGEWPDDLVDELARYGYQMGQRIQVSPLDIIADYDVIYKDASFSTADAMANDFWTRNFQVIASNPALAMKFDLVRIFKYMARINGAKNINDFVAKGGGMNGAMAPTNMVMDQVNKGNLLSLDQAAAGMPDNGGAPSTDVQPGMGGISPEQVMAMLAGGTGGQG